MRSTQLICSRVKWIVVYFIVTLFLCSAAPTVEKENKSVSSLKEKDQELDSAESINSEMDKNSVLQESKRAHKAMQYFQYLQPPYIGSGNEYDDEAVQYISANDEDNILSRTEPIIRHKTYPDSPIYYIRLPPSPYMFVPGLGYVSQPPPPPHPINPFINVPVNFIANGKPSSIYQWSAAVPPVRPEYDFARPTVDLRPPTKPAAPSVVNLDKGPYVFNGRPTDIFVLRDSYNSLYADALQNFYP